MTPLQTALNIIALLEEIEPGLQGAVMGIVALWKQNNDVKTVLQGEVTALGLIAAKARAEEGLAPGAPEADPDPTPATPQ